MVSASKPASLLDIATGTGDVLAAVCRAVPGLTSVWGIDQSAAMLVMAQQKIKRLGLAHKIKIQRGDAQSLAFPDNYYSVATIAFGIRNMSDPRKVLEEIRRVLIPNGRVYILEFSQPQNAILRLIYSFYLRFYVPFLGGLLSGAPAAYRYLHKTIQEFPFGEAFADLLRRQNFHEVQVTPLCCGIVTIYQATK